jgi:AmmeMemoRadiSam system protein B
MPASARPQPRPYLLPIHDPDDSRHVYLVDQLGILTAPVRLARREFAWLLLCDGERTLRDVQAEAARLGRGEIVPLEDLQRLTDRMESEGVLDGPTFRQLADSPVREPRCIGCYEGEPDALRRQMRRLFAAPRGPGLPLAPRPDGRLRAALIPHIDYPRGGHTYAWGFKEVYEKTDAALFVIIGTSHYGAHPDTLGRTGRRSPRFTLTRKDFKTPLGVTPTDQDYVDRLVRAYGNGLFDDELMAHLPEHSIELEVVFLQYLYEGVRPIRIVPLVVGSFHDCVYAQDAPSRREDVGRMVEALRRVEAETPEPICYIISGDLAHIGRKFDRCSPPLTAPILEASRAQDQAILRQTEAADPLGFFRVIADEDDRRNICGLPPAYTVLEAVRPGRGRLLAYDQYVHPQGYESVSFASVAFYK